jgi:hypothetical protein
VCTAGIWSMEAVVSDAVVREKAMHPVNQKVIF